jgi:hypothetical protein
MISYALALQLRNAGFPQEGSGKWIGDPGSLIMRAGDRVYAPTLEELIIACGELDYFTLSGVGTTWMAMYGGSPGISKQRSAEGTTREQAVARLWLAVNQKV